VAREPWRIGGERPAAPGHVITSTYQTRQHNELPTALTRKYRRSTYTHRNLRRLALLATAGLATALAPVVSAADLPATPGTFPVKNGTITFARSSPDGFDIVSTRRDGSHRRLLVKSPPGATSIYSDWSPDGRSLAFDSDRTGNVEIFLRRPGGEIRQLTDNPGRDAYPSWAPDGRRIAFESDRSGRRQIHVVSRTGSHTRRVTDFAPSAEEPSYSPTGRWIAFLSGRVGRTALFVVRPDGTGVRRLTPRRLNAGHPSWSPDGRRIVFNSNIGQPNGRIWVIGRRGHGLRKLTSGPDGVEDFEPAFSPDGRFIAFTSFGRPGSDDADI